MYEEVNNTFERALVFMHKMPRIWMDYGTFMTLQCRITRTRYVIDRALRALPITQYHRIWPLYLKFVRQFDIPETAVRVYRRYLKLCPDEAEEYIEYLSEVGKLDDAAQQLATIVDNENFASKFGKSNHQLWNELCELISKNPHKVHSLNVDAIIRGGLRRYRPN
ncbi:pre-mRNA-splicing factor syf1 homolog [Teleopsis dalmanni]|uniref:pre-mRNA-splicing factor syf1 homolog n=1 Tax=Teleopsis dalmanni TaxID=139649 RepID=UPI0018CD96E2|nr:pre-mRNA-splicing factor syf1 homolog [Teleopsis dalmanni]